MKYGLNFVTFCLPTTYLHHTTVSVRYPPQIASCNRPHHQRCQRSEQRSGAHSILLHVACFPLLAQETPNRDAVVRRDELRGIGEALLNANIRGNRDPILKAVSRNKERCAWSWLFAQLVPKDGSASDFAEASPSFSDLRPLLGHGEELLDIVIRLASEDEWATWLKLSLQVAARGGSDHVFFKLLAFGGSDMLQFRPGGGRTVNAAAHGGSVAALEVLLAAGAGPFIQQGIEGHEDMSPLHSASRMGHRGFVKGLLAAGAPLEYKWMLGGTALTLAVEYGHKDTVTELLAGGADINNINDQNVATARTFSTINYPNFSPLCIAIATDNDDMVQLLLDAGAGLGQERDPLSPPPGDYDYPQPSALYIATAFSTMHGVGRMEQLLLAGANVNTVDQGGNSALHEASCHGRLDATDLLLRHNADVTLLTEKGYTAEELAMKRVRPLGPIEDKQTGRRAFTTEQIDQANELRATFRRASAWGRRGWLVVARTHQPVNVLDSRSDGNAAACGTLSLAEKCAVNDSHTSVAASGKGNDEDAGHVKHCPGSSATWRDAVSWLLECAEESLFRETLLFL